MEKIPISNLCLGGVYNILQDFFKFGAGFSQMFNYDASTFFFGPDSGICDTIMLCGVLHLYGIAKAIGPKAARIYKCQKKLNWNSSLF